MRTMLIVAICGLCLAASDAFRHPKAREAQTRYKTAIERANETHERELAAANKAYTAALQQALTLTTKAGNLDEANAINAELQRLTAPWYMGTWTVRYTNGVVRDMEFRDTTIQVYENGRKQNAWPYQVKDGVVVMDEGKWAKRLTPAGDKMLVESFVGGAPENLYGVGVRKN